MYVCIHTYVCMCVYIYTIYIYIYIYKITGGYKCNKEEKWTSEKKIVECLPLFATILDQVPEFGDSLF